MIWTNFTLMCLCATIYRTSYKCMTCMYNQIKQYYHVGLRSTFARSHVNPLMWNRQFLEANDDSNKNWIRAWQQTANRYDFC